MHFKITTTHQDDAGNPVIVYSRTAAIVRWDDDGDVLHTEQLRNEHGLRRTEIAAIELVDAPSAE